MTGPVSWWRRHDPDRAVLHRAARIAVVLPTVIAVADVVIGDPDVSSFAAFGSLAFLVYFDLPAGRRKRAATYPVLVVWGLGAIAVGTVSAASVWAAVPVTAVSAFAVLYGGLVSRTLSTAPVAFLLPAVLSLTVPAHGAVTTVVGLRCCGWLLAAVIAVPVGLVMFPPHPRDRMRSTLVTTLDATARALDPTTVDASLALTSARASADVLVGIVSTPPVRPWGVGRAEVAESRMLDQLVWLCAELDQFVGSTPRALRHASAAVLRASARVVGLTPLPTGGRAGVSRVEHPAVLELLDAATGLGRLTAQVDVGPSRTLAVVAGSIAALATNASALTPRWHRDGSGHRLVAVRDAGAGWRRLLDGASGSGTVWFRNSLRGAVGLAVAVLVASLLDDQHAYWVVLGALSVLRSNALGTGTTAVRSVLGTSAGLVLGGLVLLVLHRNTDGLWVLLPVLAFIAAMAPSMVSYAAGQCAFTVLSVALINIAAPVGWRVGLVRVDDVATGCAVSVVVGMLLWPRGAAGALGRALATAASALAAQVALRVGHEPAGTPGPGGPGPGEKETDRARWRADEAMRQYLNERGGRRLDPALAASVLSGLTRVHTSISLPPGPGPSDPPGSRDASSQLARALVAHCEIDVATARDFVAHTRGHRAAADLVAPPPPPALDDLVAEELHAAAGDPERRRQVDAWRSAGADLVLQRATHRQLHAALTGAGRSTPRHRRSP